HTDYVSALAFSPDGKTFASGSCDKTLRLWDTATGKEQRLLRHTGEVMAVAFPPDGKSLLLAEGDGKIRRWDLTTLAETKAVRVKHASMGFGSMAFSPDGRWCATGNYWFCKDEDKKMAGVAVWDIATGKVIARFEGHRAKVLALMFSPDGKQVASGGVGT